MAEFDKYARRYAEIIDENAGFTGERFEYYIGLRVGLMAETLHRVSIRTDDLRILDFGCGIGVTEKYLADRFPGAPIDGVDVSPESIAVARETVGVVARFTQLDKEGTLPFPDESFDLIYSNGTIHHIPLLDRGRAVSELRRVLSRQGLCFIFENNPYNPLMMRAMRRNPFDGDAKPVTAGKLRNMMMDAGFDVRGTAYYFFYPGLLKFLRPTERFMRWLPLGAQYFVWGGKTR